MLVSVDNIRVCLHLNPLNCSCCVNLFILQYITISFPQITANNLKTPCIVFTCGTLLGPSTRSYRISFPVDDAKYTFQSFSFHKFCWFLLFFLFFLSQTIADWVVPKLVLFIIFFVLFWCLTSTTKIVYQWIPNKFCCLSSGKIFLTQFCFTQLLHLSAHTGWCVSVCARGFG